MSSNFDSCAADAAKHEGMDRVERNACAEWRAAMFYLTVEVAKQHSLFTADDVFELAEENNLRMEVDTHDYRAFGPVMLQAAKAGLCSLENVAPIPSRRKTLHASPRRVWRSHICQAGTGFLNGLSDKALVALSKGKAELERRKSDAPQL